MATNHDIRVLVLSADDFEDMELLYPLYRLREERIAVTLATPGGVSVTGKRGHGPVAADTAIGDVQVQDYDALVIPGGYAPDKLRRDQHVLELVQSFDRAAKPIAFICHAGWVPISAGILSGRRATSVGAIRDDMVNAGVDWVDAPTVVDGHLISARVPDDLGPWMQALLGALLSTSDEERAARLAQEVAETNPDRPPGGRPSSRSWPRSTSPRRAASSATTTREPAAERPGAGRLARPT